MTKQDVLNLYSGLQAVSGLPGAKWAYGVARNMAKLRPEIEALQKAYVPSEEFIEYEKERVKLAQKHSVKEKGESKKIKVGANEEYLIGDKDKFKQELVKLRKKYKKIIDKEQKQLDDFNEILKEEVEIDFYLIFSDYIPEEITPAQVSAIMPVISEKEAKT